MKNETKSLSEYKAPKCKMVEVRLDNCILGGSNTFQINRWEEDEEELSC